MVSGAVAKITQINFSDSDLVFEDLGKLFSPSYITLIIVATNSSVIIWGTRWVHIQSNYRSICLTAKD